MDFSAEDLFSHFGSRFGCGKCPAGKIVILAQCALLYHLGISSLFSCLTGFYCSSFVVSLAWLILQKLHILGCNRNCFVIVTGEYRVCCQ